MLTVFGLALRSRKPQKEQTSRGGKRVDPALAPRPVRVARLGVRSLREARKRVRDATFQGQAGAMGHAKFCTAMPQ